MRRCFVKHKRSAQGVHWTIMQGLTIMCVVIALRRAWPGSVSHHQPLVLSTAAPALNLPLPLSCPVASLRHVTPSAMPICFTPLRVPTVPFSMLHGVYQCGRGNLTAVAFIQGDKCFTPACLGRARAAPGCRGQVGRHMAVAGSMAHTCSHTGSVQTHSEHAHTLPMCCQVCAAAQGIHDACVCMRLQLGC